MDALLLMFLAALGAIGWLVGMARPRSPWWFRIMAVVAIALLTGYFLWLMVNAEPGWTSAHIKTGYGWVILITVGVLVLLSGGAADRPWPDDHGGALSA